MMMPSVKEEGVIEQYIVLETHIRQNQAFVEQLFIYQSLDAIKATMKRTTNIVFSISIHCFYLNDYFRIFLIDQNYFSTYEKCDKQHWNYQRGISIHGCHLYKVMKSDNLQPHLIRWAGN